MSELRVKIGEIAKRRGFYWKSYEIYGGLGGFYDYGPLGSVLKDNIIQLWKEHFVLKDGLLLIDSPNIGPELMYKASGHAEKFTDYMVKCKKCGHAFRADELLKSCMENPEKLDEKGLWKAIKENNVRCPDCGGELGYPERFHLMFTTQVGLNKKAFLRPETAQGIFINFPILYRLNREKLPMGVAQIGKGFRNEISPRQGLLRLREFNMAEIEFFIDPQADFPLGEEENVILPLLTREGKELKIKAGEAVELGILSSPIAYFMARSLKFLRALGIDENKLRFRQHFKEELAHYSRDTWDCEVLLSQGWVEVIGIADRGDYDLKRHMHYSGRDLTALRRFKEPKRIKIKKLRAKMDVLGPLFKGEAKKIAEIIDNMDYREGDIEIELNGKRVKVPENAYEIVFEEESIGGERFIPHVIEPSFGIDRLIYAVLEHSYYERAERGYKVLKLKPRIAPIKAGVFPLMSKEPLAKVARNIVTLLRNRGVNCYYDDSGSIGRRYARADEIGVPFCITVDHTTLEDSTVTIRERDSMEQTRVKIEELGDKLINLIEGNLKFEEV
ncbi:MAG: glycine--tRNA ligase [Thermoplasmata archaeon]|nr:glycine--tRNA ligase [Thermoplasmata archaeon]